jgi:hypothetical protein
VNTLSNLACQYDKLWYVAELILDPNQVRNGVLRTIINVGISLEIAELILVTLHTIEMGLNCQPYYRQRAVSPVLLIDDRCHHITPL